MTIADIQKIAAEAVANALRLTQTAEAPAPVQAAKPSGDALREKRLAALAKARAAKRAKAAPASPAAKPASKPATAKASKPGESVTVIGGIEIVDYTREDGTPGVVIRPKGRRRGIAFGKGDFALYAAFVNTLRSGECEKVTKAVVARTGR